VAGFLHNPGTPETGAVSGIPGATANSEETAQGCSNLVLKQQNSMYTGSMATQSFHLPI